MELVVILSHESSINEKMMADICINLPVASFIYCPSNDARASKAQAQILVRMAHDKKIPVIIYRDSQLMGQVQADGLLVNEDADGLAETLAKMPSDKMVGAIAPPNRHAAMLLGEKMPDFLFIGKLDKEESFYNDANLLEFSLWWQEVMTIPVVAYLHDNDMDNLQHFKQEGIEFTALEGSFLQKTPIAQLTTIRS